MSPAFVRHWGHRDEGELEPALEVGGGMDMHKSRTGLCRDLFRVTGGCEGSGAGRNRL